MNEIKGAKKENLKARIEIFCGKISVIRIL
jgi:hypothetical protein